MTHIGNFHQTRSHLNEWVDRLGSRRSGWPVERPWALFGSAVMQLHDLREDISDVDIAVHFELFEALAGDSWSKLRVPHAMHPPYIERRDVGGNGNVHIFYDWRRDEPEIDMHEVRRGDLIIGGWPCAPLTLIRNHKMWSSVYCQRRFGCVPAPWRKHEADIEAIDRYLAAT